MRKAGLLSVIIGFCSMFFLNAQPQKVLIDDIVAIVGSDVLLRSDIENQVQQLFMQGMAEKGEKTFCQVLEQSIIQKMLLTQARFDSLPVTEDQVNQEMDRRLTIFIQQAGGRDKLEEALGKSIDDIRTDFKKTIEEQLLVQQMQQNITGKARVTPGDVRSYFNAIPKDSLPYIPSEVQIGQLMLRPPIRESEKDKVRKQLADIRQQILDGSSFSLKAKLYSEDGSAATGGELGFLRREDLVGNFAAAAFSLDNTDSISPVIETEFGFHIIQLIEKRGELANFRHILIKPKVLTADIYATVDRLDSIYNAIKKGTLTFADAAARFSMDEATKNNGGLLINPINGSNKFTMDELAEIDGQTFRSIEKLKVGQIDKPSIYDEQSGGKVVKIIYIVSKTEPHVASLDSDYSKIQQAALNEKQSTLLNSWVEDKKDDFYIKISEEFKKCSFEIHWFGAKP